MIKPCEHCNSTNTKVSETYPDCYFCLDCKDGGPLSPQLNLFEYQKKALKEMREFAKKNKVGIIMHVQPRIGKSKPPLKNPHIEDIRKIWKEMGLTPPDVDIIPVHYIDYMGKLS